MDTKIFSFSLKAKILLLSFLMLLDFLLSYIGIKYHIIYEGNPLLISLFSLPFYKALGVRIINIAFVATLLLSAVKWMKPHQEKTVRTGISICLCVNFFIAMAHTNWIFRFLFF